MSKLLRLLVLFNRITFVFVAGVLLSCTTLLGQTFTDFTFTSADPWVTYDSAARTYYYTASSGTGITIRSSATLTGLGGATAVTVWVAPASGPNSTAIWAPELHKIDAQWYIYYSATDTLSGYSGHRLFVLKANQSTPINVGNPASSYSEGMTGSPHGQLVDSTGRYAYDPDVFYAADNNLYLTWSSGTGLQIAQMMGALHLASNAVNISSATSAWEQRGNNSIEEGPVGLVTPSAYRPIGVNTTFITYSASYAASNNAYCVGLLYNADPANILNAASWHKLGPIFDHHGNIYGPGSVVFVPSLDNREWWTLYHAEPNNSCPPYNCREVAMQKLYFNTTNGFPVLGYPINWGLAIPVPSGEQGYTSPTTSAAVPWGPAWGDAAEGNPNGGAVVGNWPSTDPTSNHNTTLGGSTNQIFEGSNPNLENYTLSADLKWNQTGNTSPYPKYGLSVSYSDGNNNMSVFIDIKNHVVASYGIVGGTSQGFANCPLPGSFVASSWNQLQIIKAGSQYTINLNGSAVSGACQGRTFNLLNGQYGLLTLDTLASYQNISVTNPF